MTYLSFCTGDFTCGRVIRQIEFDGRSAAQEGHKLQESLTGPVTGAGIQCNGVPGEADLLQAAGKEFGIDRRAARVGRAQQ